LLSRPGPGLSIRACCGWSGTTVMRPEIGRIDFGFDSNFVIRPSNLFGRPLSHT
jgi:hypothetical protein